MAKIKKIENDLTASSTKVENKENDLTTSSTNLENKENHTATIATKIYIGPTIAKYNLQENSIYIKIYPQNVNEAIQEFPLIKKLMVDIKEIKNRNKENYEILYKNLKKEIGGK